MKVENKVINKQTPLNKPSYDDLIKAYALVRKLMNGSTILTSKLANTYYDIQNSMNESSNAIMKKLADLSDKINQEVKKAGKVMNYSSNLGYVAMGLMVAASVSNPFGAILGMLTTLTSIASAGCDIASNAMSKKVADMQVKLGGLQIASGESQNMLKMISDTNKYTNNKLTSLLKTNASLSSVINQMISELAEAIREASSRVEAGLKH